MNLATASEEQKTEFFHALMVDVARELGGFVYNPDLPGEHCYQVAGTLVSGKERATVRATLSLSTYAPTLRAEVFGTYAETNKGQRYSGGDAPRIGFLATRSAARIAGDIRRRFLPLYTVHRDKVALWVQKWDEAERVEQDTFDTLKAAGFRFNNQMREGYHNSAGVSVYGDTADLKIRNLKPALVVQVMEFLNLIPASHG